MQKGKPTVGRRRPTSYHEREQHQTENGKNMWKILGAKDGRFFPVGVAFDGAGQNGDGISLVLNSLPVGAWDGRLLMFPVREKEE